MNGPEELQKLVQAMNQVAGVLAQTKYDQKDGWTIELLRNDTNLKIDTNPARNSTLEL